VSLFWRLVVSYLLVILVLSLTLLAANGAFAPILLGVHVHSIPMPDGPQAEPLASLLIELDEAYHSAFNRAFYWGIAVALLVTGPVVLFVTSQIVSPLRRMQRASSRIAAGEYRERLDAHAPGEIGELAASFNIMAAALASSEARRLDLIRNVAHEFRTPLSSLQGYIEGIEDGVFAADRPTLDAFRRQVRRLECLVNDLSLLSRVEAGEETVRAAPIELGDLLRQAVITFQPLVHGKGVALTLEPVADTLVVMADAQRSGQVLGNLLGNALRHTPEGGEVRVSVGVSQGEAVVHVRDTGEGIPSEALPHLFTRFYRVDAARSRSDTGSGIGLTIAKHFVEAQGGRIGVESRVGEGSHFWFSLPLAA
jgi:histidine kinase